MRQFALKIAAAVVLFSGFCDPAEAGRFVGFVELQYAKDFVLLSEVDRIMVVGDLGGDVRVGDCDSGFIFQASPIEVILITQGGQALWAIMWARVNVNEFPHGVFDVCRNDLMCGEWNPIVAPTEFLAVEYEFDSLTPIGVP